MNKETQTKVVNTCIVNALRIDEEHRMMILEKLVQSISDESKNKLLHLLLVSGRSKQLPHPKECEFIHPTDWNGKCFVCGKQVFVR